MIAKALRSVLELFDRLEEKLLGWLTSNYQPEEPEECAHRWFVVSTATQEVDLILECHKCMSRGVVEDPTEAEWERAFDAPTRSYRWYENSRVKYVGVFHDKS